MAPLTVTDVSKDEKIVVLMIICQRVRRGGIFFFPLWNCLLLSLLPRLTEMGSVVLGGRPPNASKLFLSFLAMRYKGRGWMLVNFL